MSMNFNQVTLCGNLTRDPETKYLANGNALCTFSVAINERYKKGEEWQETTLYVDCTAWGKTAEQGKAGNDGESKTRPDTGKPASGQALDQSRPASGMTMLTSSTS